MKVLQSVRLGALGLLLLGMSGCGSAGDVFDTRRNVGPCPVVGALYDASRMVEVGEVERHENVGFTGSIEGVRGYCRYVATNPITMQIDIDFAFGRGPKADGTERTYTYWVAVTRRDRSVLAKEPFAVKVKFDKGATIVHRTEKVEGIVIPRATETVSGSNFEVIVGFDLTPDQLAFNRAGKRFRMQVSGN